MSTRNKNSDTLVLANNLTLSYQRSVYDLKALLLRRKRSIESAVILKNINFELKRGEFVILSGANGTGKSSLLYAISGKLNPTSGHLGVYGRVSAYFGYHSGITPYDTGREAIHYLLVFHGGSVKNLDEIVLDCSTLSGLPVDLINNQPLFTYSSGMKSRLFSAVSLFHYEDITVFDETFSNTDKKYIQFAAKKIAEKRKKGGLFILVSYSENLWRLCSQHINTRYIIFGDCKILYDGHDIEKAIHAYDISEKYKVDL